MFEHESAEEYLSIIREIEFNPSATQRTIADNLGISLGKTNYLLNALIKKGVIKAKSFSRNPGKITKINYLLTNKGFQHKITLTQHFLKKKEIEYSRLKQEWDQIAVGRAKSFAI
jgi:EPS-associated MarR family transcriptional regulator